MRSVLVSIIALILYFDSALSQKNALTSIVSSIGEASSADDALQNLKTMVSEFSNDAELSRSYSSSNAVYVLNTITQELQNTVQDATNFGESALDMVGDAISAYIDDVHNRGDELIEQIAEAAGVNLDEGVAACIETAKNEGVETVKKAIEDAINCPIQITESISKDIVDIIGIPASTVTLVDNTMADLKACKTDHSGIAKAACIAKTAFSAKTKAAVLIARTSFLLTETTATTAIIAEILATCLALNQPATAWSITQTIAKMGACSAGSILSG